MNNRLARPIRDKRTGKTVNTRDDAKRLVLAMLRKRPGYQSWIHAAELLTAADSDVNSITTQIEYALLLDGRLDLQR